MISYKVTNSHFPWPDKSFQGIYHSNIPAQVWNGILVPLFIKAFFEIAKDWNDWHAHRYGSDSTNEDIIYTTDTMKLYEEWGHFSTDVTRSLKLLHGKNSTLQNSVYNLLSFV